jgi:hypothetical protein
MTAALTVVSQMAQEAVEVVQLTMIARQVISAKAVFVSQTLTLIQTLIIAGLFLNFLQ